MLHPICSKYIKSQKPQNTVPSPALQMQNALLEGRCRWPKEDGEWLESKKQPPACCCLTPCTSLAFQGSVPQTSAWTLPLELLSSRPPGFSFLNPCQGDLRGLTSKPTMPNATTACNGSMFHSGPVDGSCPPWQGVDRDPVSKEKTALPCISCLKPKL